MLRGYDLDRQIRHELLERLVRTRGVVVDDIDAVIDALEQFRQGGDLADQLILARAARVGALPVLSLDQRFSSCEGVELLVAEASLQVAISVQSLRDREACEGRSGVPTETWWHHLQSIDDAELCALIRHQRRQSLAGSGHRQAADPRAGCRCADEHAASPGWSCGLAGSEMKCSDRSD